MGRFLLVLVLLLFPLTAMEVDARFVQQIPEGDERTKRRECETQTSIALAPSLFNENVIPVSLIGSACTQTPRERAK